MEFCRKTVIITTMAAVELFGWGHVFEGERKAMKKTYLISIILTVLVLLVGAGAYVITGGAATDAEQQHGIVYDTYMKLRSNAERSTVTVMEQGVVVQTYTLRQLGILDQTLADIDASFSEIDRMPLAGFSALPIKEQLAWQESAQPAISGLPVNVNDLTLEPVLQELQAVPRFSSENAYVEFENGEFQIYPEICGNELQTDVITQQLSAQLSALTVDTSGPANLRFELTDYDCYLLPDVTVADSLFDFEGMLEESLRHMNVHVSFHGKTESLGFEDLSKLLTVSASGDILILEDALQELVSGWGAKYKKGGVPYRFDSYAAGVREIDFLTVDYDVNEQALYEQLSEQLVLLKNIELEAPWYCWREGAAFGLTDTYVEVDITNQIMTYVKSGEIVLTTDVVTGNTWGFPTPTGLYQIENKDTDCWLSGEDYNVHVDYWVGFIGHTYGVHDAQWRTKFGGDNYVMNGSHGCVNTPYDAMMKFYETIEIGVPILVYDVDPLLS